MSRYRVTITETAQPAAQPRSTIIRWTDAEQRQDALTRAARRFFGRSVHLDIERGTDGGSSAYARVLRPTYHGRGESREFAGYSVERRLRLEWEAA